MRETDPLSARHYWIVWIIHRRNLAVASHQIGTKTTLNLDYDWFSVTLLLFVYNWRLTEL